MVTIVKTENQEHLFVDKCKEIMGADSKSKGAGWWLCAIDYDNLMIVCKEWRSMRCDYVLAYSDNAVAAFVIVKNSLSVNMLIADELLCRSNGRGGTQIREAMKAEAKRLGASHFFIDNVFDADTRGYTERESKTIESGFKRFSTRYVATL